VSPKNSLATYHISPILVVLALPALRRAPPERCGGRPLVQVTHDAGTIAALPHDAFSSRPPSRSRLSRLLFLRLCILMKRPSDALLPPSRAETPPPKRVPREVGESRYSHLKFRFAPFKRAPFGDSLLCWNERGL
jgi:hypothetical protein